MNSSIPPTNLSLHSLTVWSPAKLKESNTFAPATASGRGDSITASADIGRVPGPARMISAGELGNGMDARPPARSLGRRGGERNYPR